MTETPADSPTDQERIAQRAELLPEEQDAGSEDPQDQAAAILQDSDERTEQAAEQTAEQVDERSQVR